MQHIEVISAREISPDLREKWISILHATSALESPYFHPEFTAAVGHARSDAYVGIIHEGNDVVAFLPFHRKSYAVGAPIGGPISDYQGIISTDPDKYMNCQALKRMRLSAFDFNHALSAQSLFASHAYLQTSSPIIDLGRGFDSWRDNRKKAGISDIKNVERKSRKAARDLGPLQLVENDKTEHAWQSFIEWKSQALRDLGVTPFTETPWIMQTMEAIHAVDNEDFAGALSSLYAGDQLIAVHFGMRTSTVLHWWFPTFSQEFSAYSPGLILLYELARHCDSTSINKIDLGRGDARYKTSFANSSISICEGSLTACPSISSGLRRIRTPLQKASYAILPNRISDLTRRAGNRILRACALKDE